MARTMFDSNPLGAVGHLVYRPFKPLEPGVIVRYLGADPNAKFSSSVFERMEVRWLDGSTTVEMLGHLQDFEHHTTEHKLKYQKFAALALKFGKIL